MHRLNCPALFLLFGVDSSSCAAGFQDQEAKTLRIHYLRIGLRPCYTLAVYTLAATCSDCNGRNHLVILRGMSHQRNLACQ
eukprot:5593960-Amphidinium_carterae.1